MRVIASTFQQLSQQGNGQEASPNQYHRIDFLPHYSTLFKRFKPLLYKHLAVRGMQTMETVIIRKAGARAKTYSRNGVPLAPVHVVLPSEYARADVACEPVYTLMRSTSLDNTTPGSECIDTWPLISARKWFYGPRSFVSVDNDGRGSLLQTFAEAGDTVSIRILGSTNLHHELSDNFSDFSGNDATGLVGEILHVWTAHNANRRGQPAFSSELPLGISERDTNIINRLQFSSYSSPSDKVDVYIPELPTVDVSEVEGQKKRVSPQMREAVRLRKKALQRQKTETEQAWMSWQKPLLKPGDLVALLRPRTPLTDSGSRILLVNRFWTEQEERSRHILWVPAAEPIETEYENTSSLQGFSSLGIQDNELYRYVRQVKLTSTSSQTRGPHKFPAISSHGTLDSGEKYFIYRFLLFWDGFEVARGKSASGEGFYLACLNLPPHARSSPSAVRILSLTPPGVKGEAVFKSIQQDILKGMTDGFLDYDAHGNKVRIFLDLVGFLGDTPAINSALDVLGHTGNACCHLCRVIRRSTSLVGSRYTRPGFNALSSATGRGFFQHCAVRDSDAKAETCRLLGMRPTQPDKVLPIHNLRAAMLEARRSIPTTRNGVPVIPGYLDPYRSCLVAPDHLLTGHFRDCVNTGFRLLPSRQYRKATEDSMLGLLAESGLPTQNRIFDFEKKALYSMSMTELYALSVIAHSSFVRACISLRSSDTSISNKFCLALDVIRSCASLISLLWNPRSLETKPYSLTTPSLLGSIQEATTSHISQVRQLCTMDDSDVQALECPTTSRYRKSELSKQYRDCMIAIKTIDKPNIHRLAELVFSTLPMVGCVSRVGELVLEKAHQTLKRALRQSNNRDSQLQSVLSAVFTDWQARLTMQVPGALQKEHNSVRGCLRLLAGREAIHRLHGKVTDDHSVMIRSALGPGSCVHILLQKQSKSVLSPRANMNEPLQWVLEKNIEYATPVDTIDSEMRAKPYRAFQGVCQLLDFHSLLTFRDEVRISHRDSVSDRIFQVGHVLEVPCRKHPSLSAHFPIVDHYPDSVTESQHNHSLSVVPLFCGVVSLFSRQAASGNAEYWAAVFPCITQIHVPTQTEALYRLPRYRFLEKITFVALNRNLNRAALVPICPDFPCATSASTGRFIHGTGCSPFSGNTFFLVTRAEGYPPRAG